jgi:acyl-CoA reductase-like NAD-dependent aldehyde dehydrogenase
MMPAILDKVTAEMHIYRTESFGPSITLVQMATEEAALCKSVLILSLPQ